jgi:type IV pilus assembly protein PilA
MAERHRGFTVIEMLVVIAMIAILSAIAIPSLQGRIVRKQIDASLPLADLAKKPIAASWTLTQVFPINNAGAGIPASDKIVNNFVSAMSVENGAIHITFGNRAHGAIAGKIITVRPAVISDEPTVPITWVCGKAEAPNKMTVIGIDKTNVPDTYLPLDCRKLKP